MFRFPQSSKNLVSSTTTQCTNRTRSPRLLLLSPHFALTASLSLGQSLPKGKVLFILWPSFDIIIRHRMKHSTIHLCIMFRNRIPLIPKERIGKGIDKVIWIDFWNRSFGDTAHFRGVRQDTSAIDVVEKGFW